MGKAKLRGEHMQLKLVYKKVVEWDYFFEHAMLSIYNLFRFENRDDQMGISLSFSYVGDVVCVFAHSRMELKSAVVCFKSDIEFDDLEEYDVFEERVFEELVGEYLTPDDIGEYPTLDEALVRALEKVVSEMRR